VRSEDSGATDGHVDKTTDAAMVAVVQGKAAAGSMEDGDRRWDRCAGSDVPGESCVLGLGAVRWRHERPLCAVCCVLSGLLCAGLGPRAGCLCLDCGLGGSWDNVFGTVPVLPL
jgi:hypothetical protein